eukprot:COSAG02_NODE_10797_length_1856_cov_1.531019_1_plen_116_part_10
MLLENCRSPASFFTAQSDCALSPPFSPTFFFDRHLWASPIAALLGLQVHQGPGATDWHKGRSGSWCHGVLPQAVATGPHARTNRPDHTTTEATQVRTSERTAPVVLGSKQRLLALS